MLTKELMENNYMEALLRASLLLGELQTTVPISKITIAAFRRSDPQHSPRIRCRIVVEPPEHNPKLSQTRDYLILYPEPPLS